MLPQLIGALDQIKVEGFAFRKERALRQAAPASFLEYLEDTLPSGWSANYPHIQAFAEHLDAVENGEIDRLIILAPPRHAKTENVTVRGSAYCLERNPSENILITGYNERFARRLSRKARNIAQTRIKIASDKTAVDEWITEHGGTFMARGVGTPPTGIGFRRIFVDDPIRKREEAESELYREKLWDWYTDDLYTRLEPGGAIVLCQTHWHYDDLASRVQASEPGAWTVLRLPAVAEDADPLGRAVGDPLWPERYDSVALKRIRDVMRREEGDYSWEALYQQNPSPREGGLFKVGKLTIVDSVPPSVSKKCRAYDLAASEGKGDYTAGVLMSGPDADGLYYVEHVWRERLDASARDALMRSTAERDGVGVKIRVPQDPGQAGKQQAAHLVRLFAGYAVKCEPVSGAKDVRAMPFASQVNAGNVRLVRGSWNSDYIEELRQFDSGKHDDQVDASADAFNELASPVKVYA